MSLANLKATGIETEVALLRRLVRILNSSFGINGKKVISTTAVTVPTAPHEAFCAIQAIDDTVINTVTDTSSETSPITSVALAAGTTIYGYFTSITLTSGKVFAYYV